MARQDVPMATALGRGLTRKCPNCGQASCFRGYVKVVDSCPNCQEPLSAYPADDGPAYVTILLVGHLVIAPALLMNVFYTYPVGIVLPSLLAGIVALTLILLPFVKGGFLALVWKLGIKRR